MVKTILEDGRDIKQIELVVKNQIRRYTVDDDEDTIFTKIEPYIETGNILCFAIYDGGEEPIEKVQFNGFVSSTVYFKD